MYLNTVFKYNVFKYCPALPIRSLQYSQPGITVASEEAALTPACLRGCLHHSQIPYLPLAPDKCINKPILTEVEHMGIRMKRLKD